MNIKALYSFVLLFLSLALVPRNVAAESSAELYWKSKLGSITMPKVLKASLQLGSNDEIIKLNPEFQDASSVEQLEQKYAVHAKYAQNPNSLLRDGEVIWFTNENLTTAGTTMKLHFNQIDNGAKFLPSQVTKSMANATNKLQAILNILSLDPKSIAATFIKEMFKDCASKGIKDEVRYCATSLETMVDFVTDSRKDKHTVVSTEQEKDTFMEYTIQEAQQIENDDKNTLVCHRLINPYAVFLCHNIKNTDVYRVSLTSLDKKQMNAIAVCHKDTSAWYREHLAFQLLNLKPGGKPICHFLSGDTVIWL